MNPFDAPIRQHMTRDVVVCRPDAVLPDVARRLDERQISAVPIVDDAGAIVGVISRTDLVHAGRLLAPVHRGAPALVLPPRRAGELIKRPPVVCAPDTSLRDAARIMRAQRVHRLFVVDGDALVGVISTLDLTAVVRDARIGSPISEIMSSPILTVQATQPLSIAIERLDRAHITGLVVVDDDWPIGVFTQVEALHARDLPRDTPIDDLLEPAIICMPVATRARHAAAQAARLDVRRVIACAHREPVGMVTGLDFAKIVAA
jgi:CBS domain-containing protein